MNEELNEALEQVRDDHIAGAAAYHKRRWPIYFGAVAAVLVVAILVGILLSGKTPLSPVAYGRVAAPEYPKMVPYQPYSENREGYQEWQAGLAQQYDQPEGYADGLDTFFKESIPAFLEAAGEGNAVCSPVNIYMALAMLAECAEGGSRQEILDLLGVGSIQELRTQASYVWNAHYRDDGFVKLLLGNSLWLDDAYRFRQDTVDILADQYYASVYHGDLGTDAMNVALREWVNEQTGGLLKEHADALELDPDTVLALASTIEYRANWVDSFSYKANSQEIFHGPNGDMTATFMNQTYDEKTFFWAEEFTAARLGLDGSSAMWLILPDEGKSVADILDAGTAFALGDREGTTSKKVKVNLSLPKFDIDSKADLVGAMQSLGVTEIFGENADLSGIVDGDDEVSVSKIEHAARVAIDSKGVVGVAYTVVDMMVECDPLPLPDEVDFVLDRPFLFVITSSDGLPLFTGTVMQP